MIPKSGYRFSKRSCSNNRVERDGDSKKNHLALVRSPTSVFQTEGTRIMAAQMLAYSITSSNHQVEVPFLVIGSRGNAISMYPTNPTLGCYWIVIISAQNPKQKVKEWIVPGTSNSTVPPDLDSYMSNPDYIFAVATYALGSLRMPQGDFYDYLVKYGAGRELQKLEQVNALTFSGSYSQVSYILTGQCGPRGKGEPSYEAGSVYGNVAAILLLSLASMPNGQPPYGII